MSRALLFLGLFGFSLGASKAQALISAQAEVGSRMASIEMPNSDKKATASGAELQVTAQLDPIPLVPVGFGLMIATTNLNIKDSDDVKKLTGTFVVPHISAWVPNPTDFKPFARLGYAVYGTLSGSGTLPDDAGPLAGKEINEAYSLTGPLLGVGVKWSFLPLVSAMFEYQMFNPKLKLTKLEIAGESFKETASEAKMTSGAVLVGVEVGF